jgi:Mn2+/Fe2+ NRAMP family transporter
VRLGGFALFEKVMTVCIGIMFVVVVATAVALHPPLEDVGRGLFIPTIPQFHDGGLSWTVALLGGVGGTVTVLCYGYWIREQGREGSESLRVCRLDLATAYVMTALFGMAMVVIGSRLPAAKGGGARLLADLADNLRQPFGAAGGIMRWAFLLGAWGAVFSSLLGVWQSVPYLFTDFWNLATARQSDPKPRVDTASRAYRGALYGLATVPIIGLWLSSFQTAQKTYAIVGAMIIPALAAVLLYLNNRVSLVRPNYRSGWKANAILVVALVFFLYAGWAAIQENS